MEGEFSNKEENFELIKIHESFRTLGVMKKNPKLGLLGLGKVGLNVLAHYANRTRFDINWITIGQQPIGKRCDRERTLVSDRFN
jgi:hypothetical protein